MMVQAIRSAAADAGLDALPAQFESISLPQGMWQYRNPGRLIAEALGCPAARTIVSDLGVLQLTIFNDLCTRIASGRQEIGVITGGEAQFRALRSMIMRQPAPDTVQGQDTPPPDVFLKSADPFCSDLETQRGLHLPAEFFAIIESALRYHRGLGVDEHRQRLAELYSSFSRIAAENPHAWRREAVHAEDLRDPSPKNPYVAFPYTRRHCSQWNVNHGVAIIVCSAAKARALGLDPARWIYPRAAVESRHVVVLAQQKQLHTRPGTVMCGERALALAGIGVYDINFADLYSCFPAALQSFARDLNLEGVCPLTVTGTMSFAGGPFNHYSLEALARMVEVLRDAKTPERRTGLVSNLSGIFGKQCCVILSACPGDSGYRYEDITRLVAENDAPVPLDGSYVGPATIVGYTVMFNHDQPSHAVAICDTAGGRRTVARTQERPLLEAMTREEFCGRTVQVELDGHFRQRPRDGA